MYLLVILALFLVGRMIYMYHVPLKRHKIKQPHAKTLIILGSGNCCPYYAVKSISSKGGHTSEMFRLIKQINPHLFSPRFYISAETDSLSADKALEFESSVASNTEHVIFFVPRARAVGQSYISSIYTTLVASLHSLFKFITIRPDIVLCNGPGTCIPFILFAYLSRLLFIKYIPVIYIESFARVKTLSLSGKIAYRLVDRFIVQWRDLADKYGRAEYYGVLV